MRGNTKRAVPTGLESARRRFERWRAGHEGRPRIPDSLWSLATRAARQFGVHRTCRALRLDYKVLKRHVEAASAPGASGHASHQDFVELMPAPVASRADCVVQIEDPSGSRMRIELNGVAAADVVALTRSLRADGA